MTNSITYNCYHHQTRSGEQFVPEHVFSYQISGTNKFTDGTHEDVFEEGSFRLTRRNSLIKFDKQPRPGGEYKNISVYLDQETLKNFSAEYGYKADKHVHTPAAIPLVSHPLLKSFVDSLQPYDKPIGNPLLLSIKLKEAIVLLLETNPFVKDILFDMTEPGKIDIEAFMNRNFHYNVSLDRFAYLTGRSLSTFKRDFEKQFSLPPGKWLQQKRLQQAYYLIKEKGVAPSDVYIDVGFEDLSHFSFAFKKMYGAAPSKI
jgi:AraC family transcriptional regulator, exoenzyme S synthesis regulatory protein ExsA